MKSDIIATIMETNIVDYVGLCERLTGVNMIKFLNDNYYRFVHDNIQRNKGIFGQIVADRQWAYWDARDTSRNAFNACNTARGILDDIGKNSRALGENGFSISMAIVTGPVLKVQDDYVGDICNLCSRLDTTCREYGVSILIDGTTADVCGRFEFRELDVIRVKGKTYPLKIYELLNVQH
jgi:adenylate cyclase